MKRIKFGKLVKANSTQSLLNLFEISKKYEANVVAKNFSKWPSCLVINKHKNELFSCAPLIDFGRLFLKLNLLNIVLTFLNSIKSMRPMMWQNVEVNTWRTGNHGDTLHASVPKLPSILQHQPINHCPVNQIIAATYKHRRIERYNVEPLSSLLICLFFHFFPHKISQILCSK